MLVRCQLPVASKSLLSYFGDWKLGTGNSELGNHHQRVTPQRAETTPAASGRARPPSR